VDLAATLGLKALDLAATSDPTALNLGLATRPCHKSVITK